MKLTKEQDEAIKRDLEPYGFKDIDTSEFYECMGSGPYLIFKRFLHGLDDFAKMLKINKKDIGMNGTFSLAFRLCDQKEKIERSRRYAAGRFEEKTNTICVGFISHVSFAHEWGHAFDKAMGNVILGKDPSTPLSQTLAEEEYLSSQMKDAIFTLRYQEKCIDVGKHLAETMPGYDYRYPFRPTEMFARGVEAMVSNRCINPDVDFTVLSSDHRDPNEVYDNGGIVESRVQHIQSYLLPLMNKVEQHLFEEKLDFLIEYAKERGLMHDPSIEIEAEYIVDESCEQAKIIGTSHSYNDLTVNKYTVSDYTLQRFLSVALNRRIPPSEDDEMFIKYEPFNDEYYSTYGDDVWENHLLIEPMLSDLDEFKHLIRSQRMNNDTIVS